jgi:phage terminase small subunit
MHLLQGTFRKDRHGDRLQEPAPAKGAEMPEALLGDPVAVGFWNKWAPVVTKIGVLTEADAMSFGRLCRRWAEDLGRTKMLDPETGLRLPSDPRLDAEIRQLEDRFGLNPASRSKLKAEAHAKPQSKLEKLRAR